MRGVAGHRLPPALPADPPPPGHRRTGFPLLLHPRRLAGGQGPADPRCWAALAGGRGLRVRQGLPDLDQSQVQLYTAIGRHPVLVWSPWRSAPSPPPLLRDRTDTEATPPAWPGQPPPADPGMIPADRPRDHPPAHHPARLAQTTRPHRALGGLAPPPGTCTLVSPARTPHPRHCNCPGQRLNKCCRTRDLRPSVP